MEGSHWNDASFSKFFEELTKNVNGFLGAGEAYFLYNTAKKCSGKGVIVEIGSWQGKSTIVLGRGSQAGNNVKIYAIDPHTVSSVIQNLKQKRSTFNIFQKNIHQFNVDNVIIPMVNTSREVGKTWKNLPIEFLWIDGAHDYQNVRLDFFTWNPFLIEGGIIAFHDTTISEGPKRLTRQYLFLGKNFKSIGFVGGTTYAVKCHSLYVRDIIQNRVTLLLRSLYSVIIWMGLKGANVRRFRKFMSLMRPIKKIIRRF